MFAGVMALLPAWLTLTFAGWSGFRRLWAPSLAVGLFYGGTLWLVTVRVSFYPAALAASLAALLATVAAAGLVARACCAAAYSTAWSGQPCSGWPAGR